MTGFYRYIFLLIALFGWAQAGEIEIDLYVPRFYTPLYDSIYLSGSFNNWAANDENYKLTKLKNNLYTLTTFLPVGNHQFKFTRGSWDKTEANSDGSFVSNRVLNVASAAKLSFTYTVQQWSDMRVGRNTAAGNVHVIQSKFDCPQLNSSKQVWVYLPTDYNYATSKRYSVMYMSDAQNLFDSVYSSYGDEWGIDETMERFFAQNKETAIIVGIETRENRRTEMSPFVNETLGEGGRGDDYIDFIVHNVKPFIDANFRTKKEREWTMIGGSSMGGLASFYAGLKFQNVFSKVLSFSPAFFFSDEIFDYAASTPQVYSDFKVYFVCGGLEDRYPEMVPEMVKMVDILKAKGYSNVKGYLKEDGKHSEWFWNREFPAAFEYLISN